MNTADILIIFGIGIFLGVIYFSILYWVVKKINKFKSPGRMLFFSGLLRIFIIGFVFYLLIKNYPWYSLLICLGGFFVMYIIAIKSVDYLYRNESESKKSNIKSNIKGAKNKK